MNVKYTDSFRVYRLQHKCKKKVFFVCYYRHTSTDSVVSGMLDLIFTVWLVSNCWAYPQLILGASVADTICCQLPNKGGCQLAAVWGQSATEYSNIKDYTLFSDFPVVIRGYLEIMSWVYFFMQIFMPLPPGQVCLIV